MACSWFAGSVFMRYVVLSLDLVCRSAAAAVVRRGHTRNVGAESGATRIRWRLMMVRTGQRAEKRIPDVGFAAPVGTPAGVEVLSLAVLRERAPVRLGKGRITLPQRPDFHHLITLSEGRLRHTVDFTGYTLEPGAWLWVRPGQVQQWGDLENAEGTLILFERDFLDPATVAAAGLDERHAPPLLTPVGED